MSTVRAASSLSIVALGLGVAGGSAYAAGPMPGVNVTVTNTSPVPVSIQGSANISGSVAATQSGSWNVGIAGIPLVKNVDERGRNPYFVQISCQERNSNGCRATTPDVPAGKRLVLEHVNAVVEIRDPARFAGYELFTTGALVGYLPARAVNDDGVLSDYAVNESVLVFVEAGDHLTIQLLATEVDVSTGAVLSGYLVDLAR